MLLVARSSFCLIVMLAAITARADNWPQFRGPKGNGHISSSAIPLHWSETQNITWKTPIPHRGWSTPVVMDNKVWLTTATDDGHDFFAICIDAQSGKILLNKKLYSVTQSNFNNQLQVANKLV